MTLANLNRCLEWQSVALTGEKRMRKLIQERDSWIEGFKAGERPALLLAYEEIRNSELERLSTQVEKLAEYALYLEYKLTHTTELILCSVCNQPIIKPHYRCAESANKQMRELYNTWKRVDK